MAATKPKLGGKKRTTYLIVIGVAAVVAFLYYRKKKQEAEAQATGQQTGQLVAIEPEGAGRGGAGAAAGEQGIQGLPGEVGPPGPTGDVTPQAEAAAGAAGSAAGASAASAAAAAAAAQNAANTAAAVAIQGAGIQSASQAYQRGLAMAPHPSPVVLRGGATGIALPVIVGSTVTPTEAAAGIVPREHSEMAVGAPSATGRGSGEVWVRIGTPVYAPPGTPPPPPAPPPPPPPAVADYWAEQKRLHPGSW